MAGNIYFTAGEKSFEVVDISEDHSCWFLWIERSRRFTSKIKIDAYIYRVVQYINMYSHFVRIEEVLGDRKSSVIIPKIICNGKWADIAEKILGHLWKITASLKITPLSHNQFLFKMPSRQEVMRIMAGEWFWNGRKLTLKWWSLVVEIEIDAPISEFQWVKALGIPLHVWSERTFKVIGIMCGGFVATNEETKRRNHLYWARICVKKSGTVLPNKIKLGVGNRNFEIMILIDTHPKFWVAKNSKSSIGDSNATNNGKREPSSLAPLKFTNRLVG
ncbi:hypothetical protein R3W88_011763 [Solanum pinnatisectum]|uniref:DUF4283 domain-containing protein n=1 Tax=Solanum pinnatisectum TaxID=50273 RepID=A0AAV9L9J7_9SOLN|nr:hypothetical protein R3W88_011763 [Solanum pinnatisectum]